MIDEKGRLFGKINIVDLLVILVIVIAAVVLGMKFLKPGSTGTVGGGGTTTHVEYTVLVESVQPAVYESIVNNYIPSTLMASGELLDGYVTGVTAEPHEETATVNTTDGTLEIPVSPGTLDLTFTIECNVVNAITTEIGTQEVRVGKSHIVKTDKIELPNGIILDCYWGEDAENAAGAE